MERCPTHWVEYHVHAALVGQRQDLARPGFAVGIQGHFGAGLARGTAFLLAGGHRDHPGAHLRAQRHGGQAGAAAGTQHQQPLAAA